MTSILHISADFPDSIAPGKTLAVRNLLDMTPEYSHIIYSMNRTSGFGGIEVVASGEENVTAFRYRAPPWGLLQETFLNPVADWIYEDIRSRSLRIDLIHAHKLAVEGVIARRLASKLGCPYICSIWGNSDQKFIRSKPEKRNLYKKIAREAAALLPASPWIWRYASDTLDIQGGNWSYLPVITQSDSFLEAGASDSGFVSVFNLDTFRLKGTDRLLKAVSELSSGGKDTRLTIFGKGSPQSVSTVSNMISKLGLEKNIILAGPVPHEEIQSRLNRYQGFLMPTLRESYGMVFIEALFSGIPILWSADRGIDGYFDDADIGYRCNPKSVSDIALGIEYIRNNELRLKSNIAALQRDGYFEQFRKGAITRTYSRLLDSIAGSRVSD